MVVSKRSAALSKGAFWREIDESSSEVEDSEFEDEGMLTVMRHFGYLNVTSLYSDADFFRHFRVTRATFQYLIDYLQNNFSDVK
jgi:hypothetical protein